MEEFMGLTIAWTLAGRQARLANYFFGACSICGSSTVNMPSSGR